MSDRTSYFPDITFHGERVGGETKVLYQNGSSPASSVDKSSYLAWNGDILGYLNYMAEHGDQASLDKLANYFFEQDARKWTADREDTAYQRMMEDMRKAGINPYILMQSGGSPISPAAASGQSGSQLSSYEINKEKNSQNWLKVFLSVLPIAIAAIATIAAL